VHLVVGIAEERQAYRDRKDRPTETGKTGLQRQERQAYRDRKDRPTETGMRGGKGRRGGERGEGEEKGTHDKPLLETRSLTTPRRMSWPLKCPFLFPGSGTACLPRLPMKDVWSHAGTKMWFHPAKSCRDDVWSRERRGFG